MKLHLKELGTGEPLVMLHGLFGSGDNWLGVAPKLAEQFHVLLLDLRNHGQSPHSDEMDYALMANDVAEFLDAQKIESANVLGHSLGGKVAMQFALNFPSCVKRLVVADMAPRVYAPEHEPIFRALLSLDLSKFKSRREIEDALEPEIPNLILRRFLLKNLGHKPDGSYFWKINLQGLRKNYDKLGEAIVADRPFENPALFIRGGKSDYILDSDAPLIQKLFPRAKIKTIGGARHWVHADVPEEFVRIVLEFLSQSA